MKTTAAVLVETSRPLELAELTIPPLRAGQVLVEVAFSGVCRTQVMECRGQRGPDPYLPHCLGHEGSGTLIAVGPEVTKCRPGDRVILSWIKGSGGECGGTQYDWNGRAVNAGGITTFARHAVISENRITPLPDGVDLNDAALLGCAVATGAGAVLNTACVTTNQSVAVFGTGGIGLCSVMAAVIAGAHPIIAVDVLDDRLEIATKTGASHVVAATTSGPVDYIRNVAEGGVDIAVEASGRPEVMRQALAAVRPRGGTVVVIGNASHGDMLEVDPHEFNLGKRILGTWGGDTAPDRDFPRYADWIAAGKLNLQPLRSSVYPLEGINGAIDDLESGRAVRPLIDMSL